MPGALAGTLLAALLFFLNPGLPFRPLPVLRMVGVYTSLLGGATLLAMSLAARGNPRRARRWLPWGLTAALSFGAALAWTHASHYAYFLPPGMNERLLKAAMLLTLAALICFYTALLHSIQRRPYGPRSVVGLALLCLASCWVTLERRAAFVPRPEVARAGSSQEALPRPKLFVVGLDGATLDAILPLAEEGSTPFLARLLREGSYGRVTSLTPHRRASLWLTLATGKYPYKHGRVASHEHRAPGLGGDARLSLLPAGIGFHTWGTLGSRALPLDPGGRRARTLWEILPRLEIATGLVGWPDASPPGPALRFGITESFFSGPFTPGEGYPEDLSERAELFRLEEDGIDPVLRRQFGEGADPALLHALAGDLWRESLTHFLLEQFVDTQACFVLLPGLARVSERYFGGFGQVRFLGAQGTEEQIAARAVTAYYAHLDGFLERLWDGGSGPRLLAVVSAYGFEEPGLWRRSWNRLRQGGSLAGENDASPDGVLLLYGEGVREAAQLSGARLVDVVPTLLYMMRLPVARDLDGKVLLPAIDPQVLARRSITFVPTYETPR